MQSRRYHDIAVFVLRSVVVGLAAAFVLTVFAPGLVERLRGSPGVTAGAETSYARRGPVSYAEAVGRASPSVVNIYANRITNARTISRVFDPLSQRLLGYLPGPIIPRRDQSLGSGVIFGAVTC